MVVALTNTGDLCFGVVVGISCEAVLRGLAPGPQRVLVKHPHRGPSIGGFAAEDGITVLDTLVIVP